jgi:acid stress-induced BolA-like protein IbaG/YrbA
MVTVDEIRNRIEAGIPGSQVFVSGDGSKFETTVISTTFHQLSQVKRHQKVYATVSEPIGSGELHALTIKAYTPEEWESQPSV